jgi:hypothetical protein
VHFSFARSNFVANDFREPPNGIYQFPLAFNFTDVNPDDLNENEK